MPHKLYDCCDSNTCTCGRSERHGVTDYGSILRDAEEDREEKRKREERAKREKERKRVDKEFEEIVLKPKTRARKTCSANSDLIKYTKHLKSVRQALKAAEADGFCLDEIMDGLKELGNE